MALVLVGDWLQGRGLPWQPSGREGCCRGRLMVTSGRRDGGGGGGGGGFISLLDPASVFPPSLSVNQWHKCLVCTKIMPLYECRLCTIFKDPHSQRRSVFIKQPGPVWDFLLNCVWMCHCFMSKCPVKWKLIIPNPLQIKLIFVRKSESIWICFKCVLFPFRVKIISLTFLFWDYILPKYFA